VKKEKGVLPKVGIILLAVFASVVLSGVGFATWTDRIEVQGVLNTGVIDSEVSITTWVPFSDMTCGVDDLYVEQIPNPDTVTVTILEPAALGQYFCDFKLANTGTIPIKIETIEIDYGNLPDGSTVMVVGPGMAEGQQVDGVEHVLGQIFAALPDTIDPGIDYTFSVTLIVDRWNK
jgi:hypothetical protein